MTEHYTCFDDLPLTLNADDLAAALNISRAQAYLLMHCSDFPTLQIGKRMVVPKYKLLDWIEEQISKK